MPVNINTATQEELQKIPYIGQIKAERLIWFRQKYGQIRMEDLVLVASPLSEDQLREMIKVIDFSHDKTVVPPKVTTKSLGTGVTTPKPTPGNGSKGTFSASTMAKGTVPVTTPSRTSSTVTPVGTSRTVAATVTTPAQRATSNTAIASNPGKAIGTDMATGTTSQFAYMSRTLNSGIYTKNRMASSTAAVTTVVATSPVVATTTTTTTIATAATLPTTTASHTQLITSTDAGARSKTSTSTFTSQHEEMEYLLSRLMTLSHGINKNQFTEMINALPTPPNESENDDSVFDYQTTHDQIKNEHTSYTDTEKPDKSLQFSFQAATTTAQEVTTATQPEPQTPENKKKTRSRSTSKTTTTTRFKDTKSKHKNRRHRHSKHYKDDSTDSQSSISTDKDTSTDSSYSDTSSSDEYARKKTRSRHHHKHKSHRRNSRSSKKKSCNDLSSNDEDCSRSRSSKRRKERRGDPKRLPKNLRYDGKSNWLSFKQKFESYKTEVNTPAQLMFPNPRAAVPEEYGEYVTHLLQRIQKAHDTARSTLKTSTKRMKRHYDLRILLRQYSVGDVVYLLDTASVKGKAKKLCPPWKGPAIIVKKLSAYLYQVKLRNSVLVINHDRMMPCKDRELPAWITNYKKKPDEDTELSQGDDNENDEVWCICRKPWNGRFMIQCEYCEEWFHGSCINVTPSEAITIDKYKCSECSTGN